MSKSVAQANAFLNSHFRGAAYSTVTPYLGLLSDVEAETELSGGAYARVALTTSNMSAAASGSITNSAAITFPTATASQGTAKGFAVYDASSAGNLLRKSYLTSGNYLEFTAAVDDTITAPGHTFSNGDNVVLLALGGTALPTGVTQGTLYFVVSSATNTFKVSLTLGGSAVDITAVGGGQVAKVITQAVTAINQRFTFDIGALIATEV